MLTAGDGQNCLEMYYKFIKTFGPNQWIQGYPFGQPQIQNKEHQITRQNKRPKHWGWKFQVEEK